MAKEVQKTNGKIATNTQLEKNIADNVLNRITILQKQGGIHLPAHYSAANALKSAWLILQNTLDKDKRKVLETCTKESIVNCLLDMVIQGLSPAKKQCYFIAYGNTLTLARSYFGTVTVLKRLSTVHDAFARAVYETDEFEYHIDSNSLDIVIDKHVQNLDTIDPDNVKAAYSVVVRQDGTLFIEVMNKEQIQRAWRQGKAEGKSHAHKNFGEEMSKKTVLNRGCKLFINSSSDDDLLIESVNRTTELEYLPQPLEEIPGPESLSKPPEKLAEENKQPVQNQDTDPRLSDPQYFLDTLESFTTVKQCDDFYESQKENIHKLDAESIKKIDKIYNLRMR